MTIHEVSKRIGAAYFARCQRHGDEPYNSPHEMLGVLTEECMELVHAIHANDAAAIEAETMDVLIVCLHGLAAGRRTV